MCKTHFFAFHQGHAALASESSGCPSWKPTADGHRYTHFLSCKHANAKATCQATLALKSSDSRPADRAAADITRMHNWCCIADRQLQAQQAEMHRYDVSFLAASTAAGIATQAAQSCLCTQTQAAIDAFVCICWQHHSCSWAHLVLCKHRQLSAADHAWRKLG